MPVIVNTGPTPPDIEVGTTELSQQTVSVSGPDSVVKYVVAAQAEVTIDPHGLSVDRDVPLIPVDNLGKALSPVRVDPPTIHVTIPVFQNAQTKTLPVNVNVVGTPPTGYVVDSVAVDPVTVSVKGDASILAPVTKADTAAISVGAATGTIDTDVELNLPSGIVSEVKTVHVTIVMKAETGTRTYDAALVLNGRQPGLEYALDRPRPRDDRRPDRGPRPDRPGRLHRQPRRGRPRRRRPQSPADTRPPGRPDAGQRRSADGHGDRDGRSGASAPASAAP